MNITDLYQLFSEYPLIDTDTRTLRKDSLFFALSGDRFNGNEFASLALKNGAAYAIIDDPEYQITDKTILVKDSLSTLQELAQYHREQLGIPIIALTGSNGKTTTKELINKVLSTKFNIKATQGNLNNHIGVPLTLLTMNAQTDMGLVEMGANHLGEIAFLCGIAKPTIGLITNFGKAHIEGFGSLEGVIKAKSELYDYLKATNGLAFVCEDDAIQLRQSEGIERFIFGKKSIPFIQADPFVSLEIKGFRINSKLIGRYNYQNLSAALAIGDHFNIDPESLNQAICSYKPSNNRSQVIETRGLSIILDAYNANPTSMVAALENFNQLKKKEKTVILGDMFELGETAAQEHQNIAELAQSMSFDKVYLIGKAFARTTQTNAYRFSSYEDFEISYHAMEPISGSLLIKGSRGMQLERILDLLRQ
jgi:UDP-N-acetylmuramoyl-tripeptide--D-alanyl-D-alanine ligase